MASQSVSSPISQLLHSNATPPYSLRNGLFLVDFVGLHCKSKRARRKLGASSSSPLSRAVVPQFVSRRASSSPVRAVLDLQRPADFASQPKVRLVPIIGSSSSSSSSEIVMQRPCLVLLSKGCFSYFASRKEVVLVSE